MPRNLLLVACLTSAITAAASGSQKFAKHWPKPTGIARQSRVECGPAAAAAILVFFDIKTADDARLASLSDEFGLTSVKKLVDFLHAVGLNCAAVECSPEALREWRAPAILLASVDGHPDMDGDQARHFVVSLPGVAKGEVRAFDPTSLAPFKSRLEMDETMRRWGGVAVFVGRQDTTGSAVRRWWALGASIAAGVALGVMAGWLVRFIEPGRSSELVS